MRASEFIDKKIPFADGYLVASHHFLKDRSEQRNIPIESIFRLLHKLETTRKEELFRMPFITFVVKAPNLGVGLSKQKDGHGDTAYIITTAHETMRSGEDEDVFYLEETQLVERATSVVFHYTGTNAALKILQSGNFELASTTGNKSEEDYAPKGYPYFLSLTRTPTGDYHRYVGSGGVMFKMDGDWFNSRYIVKPIDYWNSAWLHSDGTRTREAEDRVFSKTPTIPITPVTEVHVLLKEQNEFRSPQTRQLMITAKQRDIPVYLYTDEKAWRLLDTRRSVQPSQAKDVLKGQPTRGSTRNPTDFVKPWIELIEKDREEYLSDRAKRQLKNLLWYHDTTGDHNIGVDLSNARKPDAGDRASAVKLIKYMNDNGFKNTIELKNAIYDKWNKIKK